MLELNQRRILVNNWHVLPIEKIYQELLTSKAGLTSEEARKRRRRYGPNEISSSKKRSVFLIFLEQFKSPLIYILIAAAILTYFLKHTVDTWVILAVVFFNAFFRKQHGSFSKSKTINPNQEKFSFFHIQKNTCKDRS